MSYLLCAHEQNRDPRRNTQLTKTELQEIRLRLAELDGDDWLEDEDSLTVHERALLKARLASYAKDPDAGSTWEEVEGDLQPNPCPYSSPDERMTSREKPSAAL